MLCCQDVDDFLALRGDRFDSGKSASVPGSHNRVRQENRTLARLSLLIKINSPESMSGLACCRQQRVQRVADE